MTFRQLVKDLTPPVLLRMKRRLMPFGQESHKGRSLRLSHERLNQGVRGNVLRLRPGIDLRMHPEAIAAAKSFCYVSPAMVEEMDSFLALTADKRRFLDIGSLHGIFSLAFAAAHPEGQVLAIDASPIAFSKLLYNVHANRFANIQTVECAVSDAPGILRMHYEWEHAVSAGTQDDAPEVMGVEKRTGDDLCESHDFIPDAIKIDVEGHEMKVLRGLSNVLSRNRPLVFLEIHPRRLIEDGDSVAAVAAYFFDKGYRAQGSDGRSMSRFEIEKLQLDERVVFVT